MTTTKSQKSRATVPPKGTIAGLFFWEPATTVTLVRCENDFYYLLMFSEIKKMRIGTALILQHFNFCCSFNLQVYSK
jgi:hypothetical protein